MLQILSKRSSCADKRPDPANLANGELAINFNSTSSNVFYKNSAGGLNVAGAATVSACAPNANPAGYSGNSPGEFWFDSSTSALKIWNGTAWYGISSGSSAGTVTSVTAGAGLTGGTISISGTIALATSGATPGTYSNACIVIDCFGRITSASCGTTPITGVTGSLPICINNTNPLQPDISVTNATTTALGVTQLVDSVSCTSTAYAATPASVKCAYDLANAALPKAGGTMTGNITFNLGQTFPVSGIQCAGLGTVGVVQLSCSVSCTSNDLAATPSAVKCAYDLANAALPKCGGTMTGNITFNAGQAIPIGGIQLATTSQCGVVCIGNNINVSSGAISVNTGTTLQKGVVQLENSTSSTCTDLAATAASVKSAYDLANSALPKSGGTMTGALCAQDVYIAAGCALIFPASCQITTITDCCQCVSSSIAASATAVSTTYNAIANKLSCSGGTMTGALTTAAAGIIFSNGTCLIRITDATDCNCSNVAASATAINATYAVANAALSRGGGEMTGNILFSNGQTFPDATALAKGVVQVGTNISVASGTISVASASTSVPGIVQLNDTVGSTSTTEALTANQGKSLQDQIDALAVVSNITLGGTFNAATGLVDSVTTQGTTAGLEVGEMLPAPGVGNEEIFVIVDVQGTNGPNTPTLVHVGDWFLSDGTDWQFLNVGFAPGQATTASQGVVQLATNAEVQAGTDPSNAVVSSALQSKISDSISTTSCTTIASSTAVKCAYDTANSALPGSTFSSKGALVAGTGVGTYSALVVGTNGYVLTADSTCSTGLKWIENTGGVSTLTVCPTLCNLGTSSNPILCAVPAPAPIGICASTQFGVVKLVNDVLNCSCDLAASAYAANNAYNVACLALPKSGGTVTGVVTFGCSGLGCPAYLEFCNGIGCGQIYGISDSYTPGCANVAASTFALASVYDLTLRVSGGTMIGAICFCGAEAGNCSSLTGTTTSLACTSTTTALAASAGCCLQTQVNNRLCLSGGAICGNIIMCAPGGGICFCVGGGCVTGITDSINNPSPILAASSCAVYTAYQCAILGIPKSTVTAKGNLIAGTAASTVTALPVGTDGQVLAACSACAAGLTWAAAGGGSPATPSVAGTVYGCTTCSTTFNTFLGATAGNATTLGTVCNTALGFAALLQATGFNNTAVGMNAGRNITSGCSNVAIGWCAQVASPSGSNQLAIGWSEQCNWLKGDSCKNLHPGGGILSTSGSLGGNGQVLTACAGGCGVCWAAIPDQTPVGTIAFFAMCTAPTGWTIADGSCVSRTTYSTLYAAIGTTYGVGDGSTTFQLPDLRGRFARGWNSTASGCDASRVFGSCQAQAFACHCHGITMCGGAAGVPEWACKDDTTAVRGYSCCGGPAVPANRQRGFSDCVGGSATETRPDNIAMLPCIKTGNSNALGVDATPTVAGAVLGCTNNLIHNTTLGCNAGAAITATTCCLTAVGKNALSLATGNNNTAIGMNAGCTLTTGANNTLIGFNAAPTTVTVSNEITLGNSSIATIRAQVTTITSLSDGRDKKFIRDIPIGLDFINNLRPVEFKWNMRDGGKVDEVDTGFIAQDLQEIQEELGYTLPGLVYEANPDRLEAGYGKLLPVLVKAIQELSEKNSELESRIKQLEGG